MITVIDYGAGNSASVSNVLKDLNCDFVISNKEIDICKAEKIIFPGVGEASSAIQKIHMLNLFSLLRLLKKPFLGICLGMQLMCNKLKEGNVTGLGIFSVNTQKFNETKMKVPHMGWDKIQLTKQSKLFDSIIEGEFYYFAHSFYVPVNDFSSSFCSYGVNFTSSMEKGNFYGIQFHPEKSGPAGIQIIKNFIEKC